MIYSNDRDPEEKSPLADLRERLGNISQEELAHKLGVTKGTVSRWEGGKTVAVMTIPQFKAFMRLLSEAKLSLDEFPDSFARSRRPTE